jgi:hypothetical protein
LRECEPDFAFVVSIVAEPPLWALAMTPHMLLSGVLSKSSPTLPFGGVEVLVGVEPVVVLVVVEVGLVDEEGACVVDALPGKH